MPKTKRDALSHRQRALLALAHKETDRIPIVQQFFNPPCEREFEAYLQRTHGMSIEQYLKPLVDFRRLHAKYVGPKLPDGTDIWGVRRRMVSYGDGAYDEIDNFILAQAKSVDDILAHRWPTTDWFDYSAVPDQIAELNKDGEYCIMAMNGAIFESGWYMRGFEQTLLDLVLNPEIPRALFEKVTDFYVAHFTKILQAANGKIDLVFTSDDIGGQRGLLMSVDMWSEHVKPHHARMNKAIHDLGARTIYHSCGAVMEAVPGLIDMGVDVLQSLQFDAAGMDPVKLKTLYGDRLCFEGGISVQTTLPKSTPEEVRQTVIDRIEVLGKGGGYICGPGHMVQAGTPAVNLVTMYDTMATYRRKSH